MNSVICGICNSNKFFAKPCLGCMREAYFELQKVSVKQAELEKRLQTARKWITQLYYPEPVPKDVPFYEIVFVEKIKKDE